jgi:hypothetical protein
LASGGESLDLVTNWTVESRSFSYKFEDYNSALSKFDNIYKGGEHVILYEIKIDPLNGSMVKKVPLLNSKRTIVNSNKNKNKNNLENKSGPSIKTKNKFHDFKMRLLLLGIVFITFLIIIYIMNVLSSGNSEVGSITHFVIPSHPINYEFSIVPVNTLLH